MRIFNKTVQLLLEGAAGFKRQVVKIRVGPCEDDQHLLFDRQRRILPLLENLNHVLPRFNCCCDALSRSEPNCAKAASARYCARSRRRLPATCRMALICALPPTRLTEMPTFTAGRMFELNRSASR